MIDDSTLTFQRLKDMLGDLEALMPRQRDPFSILGMPVFIAPEYPKVRLNYKCRTKYGDEFELLTKAQQAETDAWLIAQFGSTSHIPANTAYVINGGWGGIHLNPRDVVKLTCI